MNQTHVRRRHTASRIAVVAASAALVASALTVGYAGQAVAGEKTARTMQVLNVRSGPSSAGPVVRQIPGNTVIGINCWTEGEAVDGKYGRSNIWYTIDGGGWVTDAGIYTGTNSAVTGHCGGAPAPAPAPSSGRAMGAKMATNSGLGGQCTWGALEMWKAATGYYPNIRGNAKDYASSARASGWTVVLDAQPRSIVVFAPGVHGVDRVNGHVGWVDSVERRSDGLYIHYRDMNRYTPGQYLSGVTKDIRGMSYVLAP